MVHGVSIHKSTKLSFWPILCQVSNYPKEAPFIVAVFCGPSKPPIKDFFCDFVNEVNQFYHLPLKIEETIIQIKCRPFSCDTPARSFVKSSWGTILIMVVINVQLEELVLIKEWFF